MAMSSPTHLVSILSLTMVFLSFNVLSPPIVTADKKLVDKVCSDPNIQDHAKCLKTLSNAKAMSAKNINELVGFVATEGEEKATKTLHSMEEMMKKPTSPSALTALQTCSQVYRYSIDEFQRVIPDLKQAPPFANYDFWLIPPEVDICEKALQAAKFLIPELVEGNNELYYYAYLGYEMTENMLPY